MIFLPNLFGLSLPNDPVQSYLNVISTLNIKLFFQIVIKRLINSAISLKLEKISENSRKIKFIK